VIACKKYTETILQLTQPLAQFGLKTFLKVSGQSFKTLIKAFHRTADDLIVKTTQAKEYVQSRLMYIRDMYEGGEPPL